MARKCHFSLNVSGYETLRSTPIFGKTTKDFNYTNLGFNVADTVIFHGRIIVYFIPFNVNVFRVCMFVAACSMFVTACSMFDARNKKTLGVSLLGFNAVWTCR
jgi:hypothetical protein